MFPSPQGFDENGLKPREEEPKGERYELAKRQARRWFVRLVILGLTLGVGVAIAVVALLNQWGLTEKPDRPFMAPTERPAPP